MKIVQAAKYYYPYVGGMETTVINLSEGLLHYPNVSIKVIACQAVNSLRTEVNTINGVEVTYKPLWGTLASLPISPTYISALRKMKGDILQLHSPFPLTEMAFLLDSKIRENFSKVVVWWQSDIIKQAAILPLYLPLLHKFLKKVDRIILNNPNMLTFSNVIPQYKEKCIVIPIGIKRNIMNEINLQAVNAIRRKYGEKIVLFVGRIVYYKGIEYLIQAMKELHDAKLIIIGSGPLEKRIDEFIRISRMEDRIFRIPYVSNEDLSSYYQACDLFVLPSIEKSEAYGIVQIEAMAQGKPIICTELNTGTSFINQNGITGYVVPPKDSNAIAVAIRKLINDKDLRIKMGENGRKRVESEFTSEKMVERVYKLYNELLA